MNQRIRELLADITRLEEEFERALQAQQAQMRRELREES
jgi:hypothetical protein